MIYIISSILLSIFIILLSIGTIYFTIKLKFLQFNIIKIIKSNNKNNINTLFLSLAARVGVGSIAGIALAIYLAGPGSIFWIIVISILTSVNTYVECYLANKYKEKDGNNYKGGPSFYIEKSLNNKKLAIIYSVLIIISYIIGFITIQGNTITVSINNYLNIKKEYIAIILSIITFISIIKGLNQIIKITNILVPIMGISYIILGIIIIIKNINIIPNIIYLVIKDAFNIKKIIPCSFIYTILLSLKRSIFITESGLGTSSIASSSSNTDSSLTQILGIYLTVFIICTITALIILTSNYKNIIINNINGIELTQYALNYHLGSIGNTILLFTVIALAYSTIIAGYYYGETSLKYLITNIKNYHLLLLKIVVAILLLVGSTIKSSIIWSIVDILVEIIAIINMYVLVKLRKEIVFDYKNKK